MAAVKTPAPSRLFASLSTRGMPAPVLVTIVENDAHPTSKRRRLEPPKPASLVNHNVTPPSQLALEVEAHPALSSIEAFQEIPEDTVVCYGMILDLPVNAHSDAIAPSCTQETVIFTPTRELRCYKTKDAVGQLDNYVGEILSKLAADYELKLQLLFSASPIAVERHTKPPKGTVGFLRIIIYGPRCRFGDVGDFVTRCGCYLEDPAGCDWNVPYMNPQCLFSLHEYPPMTFDLPPLQQHSVDDFIQMPSDLLAGFETTDRYEESATPTALCTILQAHQRQALTFFLRREQGLHPSEDGIGIWLRRSNEGKNIFVNTITNRAQSTPGPIWRGGLLADEMGLGKTLSMIALIASDQDCDAGKFPPVRHSPHPEELRSTLVIVPLNVLAVWESQLKSHVYSGRLTWFNHHGKNKLQLSRATRPPDIVFTTYHTVEREKRDNKLSNGSIFSCHWKRIVLDEAHIIRNHNTSTARAIAALRATSRWAISGTPIQNNLTDFLGLFRFLHFVPYDDPKVFDDDISNLWRNKPVDEAVETFKKLLSCVMIRRTKSILDLPSREDKIIWLSFDDLEEEYYRRLERPVAEMLDQPTGEKSNPGNLWMNAIQQINKLRLVCNLGIFVPSRPPGLIQSRGNDYMPAVLAVRLSMGGEVCEQCLQPIASSSAENELVGSKSSNVYYSVCNRLFCSGCSLLLQYKAPEPCACIDHPPSCPLLPLLPFVPTSKLEPVRDSSLSQTETDNAGYISSKIRALILQIKAHPTEKNVVFSSWTSSLDMVERGLQSDGIRFVRIDGKVAMKKRAHAMQQFCSDLNIRVILITISCGACGLDLTAASRVHLLEPQWNPSTEDQALARAHRLGQTRPVTTIRYVMRNSFEQHILKVQDRKKLLATTLLSDNSSLGNLRRLLQGE